MTKGIKKMEKLNKQELSTEDLEKISGGYIYDTGEDNKDAAHRWMVVDNKGNFYKGYGSKAAAANASKAMNWNARELTYEQLLKLRENAGTN